MRYVSNLTLIRTGLWNSVVCFGRPVLVRAKIGTTRGRIPFCWYPVSASARQFQPDTALQVIEQVNYVMDVDGQDDLIELLIQIIHRIGASAERRVERELTGTLKRVTGKNTLLFRLAETALANPDGIIREVLFPVIDEQTLADLVKELKSTGPAHRQHRQRTGESKSSHPHQPSSFLPRLPDRRTLKHSRFFTSSLGFLYKLPRPVTIAFNYSPLPARK